MLEELRTDDRADRVAADVVRAGVAAAVPEEPGQRIGPALLQFAAEDVALLHPSSIARHDYCRKPWRSFGTGNGTAGRTRWSRRTTSARRWTRSVTTCWAACRPGPR